MTTGTGMHRHDDMRRRVRETRMKDERADVCFVFVRLTGSEMRHKIVGGGS